MLEQKFHSQTPNTVWLAGITYIDTPSRDHASHNPAGQWIGAANMLLGTIAS
nr:hypothetical protein [Octadecabacter antarcticus]